MTLGQFDNAQKALNAYKAIFVQLANGDCYSGRIKRIFHSVSSGSLLLDTAVGVDKKNGEESLVFIDIAAIVAVRAEVE